MQIWQYSLLTATRTQAMYILSSELNPPSGLTISTAVLFFSYIIPLLTAIIALITAIFSSRKVKRCIKMIGEATCGYYVNLNEHVKRLDVLSTNFAEDINSEKETHNSVFVWFMEQEERNAAFGGETNYIGSNKLNDFLNEVHVTMSFINSCQKQIPFSKKIMDNVVALRIELAKIIQHSKVENGKLTIIPFAKPKGQASVKCIIFNYHIGFSSILKSINDEISTTIPKMLASFWKDVSIICNPDNV